MISPELTLLSLLVAFTLAVLPDPARAVEYVTIESTEGYESVNVSPTDIVTLVGATSYTLNSTTPRAYYAPLNGISANSGRTFTLSSQKSYITSDSSLGVISPAGSNTSWTGLTQVYTATSTVAYSFTLRIDKQGESFLSNPVVLPTNVGGPIEISVETSTDSFNWSPAAPGIIPANSPLGFWRLKAKEIDGPGHGPMN